MQDNNIREKCRELATRLYELDGEVYVRRKECHFRYQPVDMRYRIRKGLESPCIPAGGYGQQDKEAADYRCY